ncbi:hypothetical protein H2199_005566 [Coniosporium tulheliwenetii]|uniref:Uncharacterized protein n=1 Tax=Coniosporium tulheliwenetii TaxID=3383036 RepID=A0ACC2Z0Z9_9PEZI|nr:hypothetical protein H2199_005566 [Cladosporium sp. JES 115]
MNQLWVSMGSIYKEIGPGQRIALCKLAVEHFEKHGRPFRLAIDISIWLFQIQSGKGGTNPALRTFYYRLLRLITLDIHPLFVFDGPNKPPFKRHRRVGGGANVKVSSIPEFLAKQLLKHFGLPYHHAPGEAEAECALLQREGVVDAVLSEDVDTLMFGSGITLKSWSVEGKGKCRRMSTWNGARGSDEWGDYIPEGIPGCGPKLAIEAARAGFGKSLCDIRQGMKDELRAWRENLCHELKTNESKLFKQKKSKLVVPEDFPSSEVLGYYTHPAISSKEKVELLRAKLKWDQGIDYAALRTFTADAFEWLNLGGARKFIRNIAPAMLVRELRMRGERGDAGSDDMEQIQEREGRLVAKIHGRRSHATTDSVPELRISFKPIDLVPIDLEAEPPDDIPEGVGEDSEDEVASLENNGDAPPGTQAAKKRGPSTYDPTVSEKIWILETYVKVGVPLTVQDWEENFRSPKKLLAMRRAERPGASRATKGKKKQAQDDTQTGAIMQYTRVTKPGSSSPRPPSRPPSSQETVPAKPQTVPQRPSKSRSPAPAFRVPRACPLSPKRDTQMDIIELLSSPEAEKCSKTRSKHPQGTNALESWDLPPTVTKRRRSPFSRSKTLPADLSHHPLLDTRPSTPPLSVYAMDVTSSSPLPSPSASQSLRFKRPKTGLNNLPAPQTAALPAGCPQQQDPALLLSPTSNQLRQQTLPECICRSPSATPTKPRPRRPGPELPSESFNPAGVPATKPLRFDFTAAETDLTDSPFAARVQPPPKRRTPPPPARPTSPNNHPNALEIEELDELDLSGLLPTVLPNPPPQPAPAPKASNNRRARPAKPIPPSIPAASEAHPTSANAEPPRQQPATTSRPVCAAQTTRQPKQAIQLRTSLEGAWRLVDAEVLDLSGGTETSLPHAPASARRTHSGIRVATTREKRKKDAGGMVGRERPAEWRLSGVECLDLTEV